MWEKICFLFTDSLQRFIYKNAIWYAKDYFLSKIYLNSERNYKNKQGGQLKFLKRTKKAQKNNYLRTLSAD